MRPTHSFVILLLASGIISTLVPGSVTLASSWNNCDPNVSICFDHQIVSNHFVVLYNTTGSGGVPDQYAKNVSIMAEMAYKKLVVEDGFPVPARNPIPIYLDRLNTGFTTFLNCILCPPATYADLAKLEIEYRVESPCSPSCGMPISYFQLSHEVFHTIQYTEYAGRIPFGLWLKEGSANWAGYHVNGNESRWDPWVISAWLGDKGNTDKSLEDRTYDNAFFFAYLTEYYGGVAIMKGILSNANISTAADQVITAQLMKLGFHKTTLDVMNEFGASILTGNFTDRDGAGAVLRLGPPIAGVVSWTGSNATLSSFTHEANGLPVGFPLQVRNPFGIEYVKINPVSDKSVSIGISNSNSSCFEDSLVTHNSSGFQVYHGSASSSFFELDHPQSYDRIFLVVTRARCSDGEFTVRLDAPSASVSQNTSAKSPGTNVVGYGAGLVVLAFVAILIYARARKRNKRPLGSLQLRTPSATSVPGSRRCQWSHLPLGRSLRRLA